MTRSSSPRLLAHCLLAHCLLAHCLLALCLSLLLLACSREETKGATATEVTPAGEALLKTRFVAAQGGPPEGEQTTSEHHERRVTIGDEAIELDVILDVGKASSGARYLEAVEVRVVEARGRSLSAAIPDGANPTNLGSHEVPVASLPLMVTWHWSHGLRQSAGSEMLTLVADGSVSQH